MPGTGAHGIQTQDGKLWFAVPPGRMIYRIDPKTWMVKVHVPDRRISPARRRDWNAGLALPLGADSNMGAFFKRDMVSGAIVDLIQLPEGSPFPHGMSVWKGYIYWTDDIGGGIAPVCRMKI